MNTAPRFRSAFRPLGNIGPGLEYYLDPVRPVSRQEQLHRLNSSWEVLYWKAVRARQRAVQYRNFAVGATVLAFRPDVSIAEGRWRAFSGMNTKVHCDARPVCAEPVAIGAAYAAGYTEVIGLVVVGEAQRDDDSGLAPAPLHLCHECRIFTSRHPLMTPRTRILTALPPQGEDDEEEPLIRWELQTLQQLLRLHGEE